MNRFKRGALAAAIAVVARAAPPIGIGIVPVKNTTTSEPKPTDSSCKAECEVRYPELRGISWVPEDLITYTTEVTVATISVITTYRSGSTKVGTVTGGWVGGLPEEYNLNRVTTNYKGTAILEVPLTISGSHTLKTLAYPTPWVDYPSEYHWLGVLPTQKESTPVCATAIDEFGIGQLVAHPEYPQPKTGTPGEDDPLGKTYKPLWVPLPDVPDKEWFGIEFPSESAFSYCESVAGKPAPTGEFYAAKFVYDTTSMTTTATDVPGWAHDETTASSFEDTSTQMTTVHHESTEDGWESTSKQTGPDKTQQTVHDELSTTGFETLNSVTDIQPTNSIPVPPTWPDIISNIFTRPSGPAEVPATPTPTFTVVPTTVNGQPTAVPAFIIPGSSATATIGQQVTINSQPTVLAAPQAALVWAPTIINGVATSAPVYIISGTSTASIGQVVTLNGQTTTLAAPPTIFTMIPTVINGVSTSVPGYIISGTITAALGQTVMLDGQPTVLAAPTPVRTLISTTIDGKPTVIPAYIISGSITAFPGQTVTVNGQLTTLAPPRVYGLMTTTINGVETVITAYIADGSSTSWLVPTGNTRKADAFMTPAGSSGTANTQFGGPATTSIGAPSDKKSASSKTLSISWNAVMIALGWLAVMWF